MTNNSTICGQSYNGCEQTIYTKTWSSNVWFLGLCCLVNCLPIKKRFLFSVYRLRLTAEMEPKYKEKRNLEYCPRPKLLNKNMIICTMDIQKHLAQKHTKHEFVQWAYKRLTEKRTIILAMDMYKQFAQE